MGWQSNLSTADQELVDQLSYYSMNGASNGAERGTSFKAAARIEALCLAEIQVDALRESLELLRQRDVQAMGAAISNRNWHAMETAYNAGRDRLDRLLIDLRQPRRKSLRESIQRAAEESRKPTEQQMQEIRRALGTSDV